MPSTDRSIFFEHVPTDINAPIIIEATIDDETQVGDAVGNQIMLMNARVDRVIRGSIDTETLKIFTYIGGCIHGGVGHGIILGELRDDPKRGVLLEANRGANVRAWSKEFLQKQMAFSDAAKCVKNEFGLRECKLTTR
jgi:hypothetical protein